MKIYIDLDGVLADLFPAVEGYYNVKSYKDLTNDHFKPLGDNYRFWRGLKPINEGIKLIQCLVASGYEYHILSRPIKDATSCMQGKIAWCEEYLGDPFSPSSIVFAQDKWRYAKGNILIDDFRRNITSWQSAGGYGIKYKPSSGKLSVSDVIDKIRKFYLKEPE